LIGGGGGATADGGVGAVLVVVGDERIEQGLELVEGGRGGVGGEPAFEGLVEAFDFAARGRVVRSRVLLDDVQAVQQGLEAVAAPFAASQSGGEHHPVVGQRGGGDPVGFQGFGEGLDDDVAGDPAMRGDGDGVARVVVEEA
jgi:hypothetical protein